MVHRYTSPPSFKKLWKYTQEDFNDKTPKEELDRWVEAADIMTLTISAEALRFTHFLGTQN